MSLDDELGKVKQAQRARKEEEARRLKAFAEHMARVRSEERQVERVLEVEQNMRNLRKAINKGRRFSRWSLERIDMNLETETYHNRPMYGEMPVCNFRGYALMGFPHPHHSERAIFVGWIGKEYNKYECPAETDYPGYESPLYIVDVDVERERTINRAADGSRYVVRDGAIHSEVVQRFVTDTIKYKQPHLGYDSGVLGSKKRTVVAQRDLLEQGDQISKVRELFVRELARTGAPYIISSR
jgi:hypothetical protein